jgi:hypothetical protein
MISRKLELGRSVCWQDGSNWKVGRIINEAVHVMSAKPSLSTGSYTFEFAAVVQALDGIYAVPLGMLKDYRRKDWEKHPPNEDAIRHPEIDRVMGI